MRFDVVTLFPAMFAAITEHGITRRAHEQGLWSLTTWNPRDFTDDAHRTVDDRPYGGGPGMVMMAEPLSLAVEAIRADGGAAQVIALAPSGRPLIDAQVRRWAERGGSMAIVCGRYEGIDQRFLDDCVEEVVSVGEFVMSGGELAAMALIDAVVRQLPGALKDASADEESFATGLLDAPHFTRPEQWRGRDVPTVLLSGHHAEIEAWRRREALVATFRDRPELIRTARAEGRLTARDEKILRELAQMGAADSKSAA
jgi:tRNA (guanine37-N1)-methyltransferase